MMNRRTPKRIIKSSPNIDPAKRALVREAVKKVIAKRKKEDKN